jgi:glycine cleavage system H protein
MLRSARIVSFQILKNRNIQLRFNASTRSYAKPFYFTKSHEWAQQKEENNNIIRVGISDNAQHKLGDIIHLEFYAQEGQSVDKGFMFAEVESVKSVSGIYAPVSGTIQKLNNQLSSNPSLLNTSPEKDGWIIEMAVDNFEEQKKDLLDIKQYKEFCDKEDEGH